MDDEKYPHEIDLGREVPDWSESPNLADATDDGKTKTVYPTLYVSDCPSLLNLPEEGCVMVKYRRVGRSESERDGEEHSSIELEIMKICHGDEEEEGEDAPGELADKLREMVDKLAAKD